VPVEGSREERSVTIDPGTVLAGKYIVERVLGEGGMGLVVAAIHAELGHRVAIKMMLPDAKGHPEMLARFEREARAAAGLSSEHAARVTDVGRFDDGMPFMVMEFLEGEDLASAITRQRCLPIVDVVRYFVQACIGLGDAHGHGIVHRDVKPSNLFLAQRSGGRFVLKVLDFGIAKASFTATNPALTHTSAQMGSPQYMSPEQLNDTKNVDARTDIWSLGASMYEALTGAPAFPATTLAGLHVKILTENPVPPSQLRPDVPPELDHVILRCLEKDLDRRYPSLEHVQSELERLQVKISTASGPFGALPFERTSLPPGAPGAATTDGFAKTAAGTDPGVSLAAASPFTGTEAPTSNTFGGIGPAAPAPKPVGRAKVAIASAGAAALAFAVAWGAFGARAADRAASSRAEASTPALAAPAPAVAIAASAASAAPPSAVGAAAPAPAPVPQAAPAIEAAVAAPAAAEVPRAAKRPVSSGAKGSGAARPAAAEEPAKVDKPKKKRSSALDPELEE
jgi:serine/threonine protein kinase